MYFQESCWDATHLAGFCSGGLSQPASKHTPEEALPFHDLHLRHRIQSRRRCRSSRERASHVIFCSFLLLYTLCYKTLAVPIHPQGQQCNWPAAGSKQQPRTEMKLFLRPQNTLFGVPGFIGKAFCQLSLCQLTCVSQSSRWLQGRWGSRGLLAALKSLPTPRAATQLGAGTSFLICICSGAGTTRLASLI